MGAAIAAELAGAGARVVAADVSDSAARTVAADLIARGLDVTPFRADVSAERDVDELAAAAAGLGPVVAWVNNAGISHRSPVLELSVDDWDRVMAINARGTFLGTRAAGRVMQAGGAVVNISSICATQAMSETTAYGASKAAVLSLTAHAALELGPRGVRVNAVTPGTIRSPMTAARLADPDQQEWSRRRIPLARVGEADEVAKLVLFLCSSASSYINGATMPCDGGWSTSA